jgi:hypothetical protein
MYTAAKRRKRDWEKQSSEVLREALAMSAKRKSTNTYPYGFRTLRQPAWALDHMLTPMPIASNTTR